MYYKTIEEEKNFRCNLWRIFDDWVISKRDNTELGTEIVNCSLICPKCKSGKIINYGITEIYHKDLRSFGMKHVCENCHEEFDRERISEDIYNHTPYEMLDHLDTPFGRFLVLRNGEPISFRYRTMKTDVDGIEMDEHFVDIDTSPMIKGDLIFAGIKGAGHEYLDGDEQCSYRSAENADYYLVLNGEEIDEYEVNIEDYSFITEGADGDGYYYMIHRDPHNFKDVVSHFCRVITLTIAWSRKDICDDYENVIEQAAW